MLGQKKLLLTFSFFCLPLAISGCEALNRLQAYPQQLVQSQPHQSCAETNLALASEAQEKSREYLALFYDSRNPHALQQSYNFHWDGRLFLSQIINCADHREEDLQNAKHINTKLRSLRKLIELNAQDAETQTLINALGEKYRQSFPRSIQ